MQDPDHHFATEDEVRLAARWFRAEHATGAVVLVHGFGAHRRDATVEAAAEAIAREQFDVLTYDSRGHGESEGLCTLGDLERYDVAAAVALAAQEHDAVFVVGASMGSIAALRFASCGSPLAKGLSGVVSVSGPARWSVPRTAATALAALVTQTPPGRSAARRFLNVRLARGWDRPSPPAALVEQIEVPLAIVHGHADRFIRSREAVELARCAAPGSRLELVDDMAHAFVAESHAPVIRSLSWCAERSLVGDAG
jgi:alpha-beta hydrolase superfamily lysophospholipase